MHDQRPGQPQEPDDQRGMFDGLWASRHDRIQREIERNRQSLVPTWVYAVTLGVLVLAWILWIILG